MTRTDPQALEKRKVAALERIADSLDILAGDIMAAPQRPMHTGIAPTRPMVQEKVAPKPEDPRESEFDSDEVPPMNDED